MRWVGNNPGWKDLTQVQGLVLSLYKGVRDVEDGEEGGPSWEECRY